MQGMGLPILTSVTLAAEKVFTNETTLSFSNKFTQNALTCLFINSRKPNFQFSQKLSPLLGTIMILTPLLMEIVPPNLPEGEIKKAICLFGKTEDLCMKATNIFFSILAVNNEFDMIPGLITGIGLSFFAALNCTPTIQAQIDPEVVVEAEFPLAA